MRYRAALISSLGIGFLTLLSAQEQEFARILRNGDEATLSAFGPRPLDLAAKKLVDEFGVAINVEDPIYLSKDDVQDVTPPRVASDGRRVLVPRSRLLETHLTLRPDGSLSDISQVVEDLVDTFNTQMPFRYRIDVDRNVFTVVATATRDEHGRFIELIPLLDRRVTVPAGTRKIFEHVNLLTQALEQQTGIRVGCCAAGALWGSTVISFEADNEPARSAFLRLLRNLPSHDRWVRVPGTGASQVVPTEPGRYYWRLRCQPAQSWCFINVAPIPDKRGPVQ